jgi:hypothetical protein
LLAAAFRYQEDCFFRWKPLDTGIDWRKTGAHPGDDLEDREAEGVVGHGSLSRCAP